MENSLIEIMKVVIPSVVALAGTLTGIYVSNRSIRREIDEKYNKEWILRNKEDQKKLYARICELVNKPIEDDGMLFSDTYMDELQKLKPSVYLLASKEIIRLYKGYCTELYTQKGDLGQLNATYICMEEKKKRLEVFLEQMRKELLDEE